MDEKKKEDLKVKDEAGNTLFGFSQVSLDNLNKQIEESNKRMDVLVLWLKRVFIVVALGLILGALLFSYLSWEVFHDNALNNVLNSCGRCMG